VWCFPAFPACWTLGSIVLRSTSIFFVSSPILEGRAEHRLDAISAEGTGEVSGELLPKLLLNLTDSLLRDTEGLGTPLVLASEASNHATPENLDVGGLEGGREGLQRASDALAVLGALHGDILTQRGVRDDGADGRAILVAHGLVDGHTARGHRREAGAHVASIELQVGRDGLGRGVRAEGLLSFLEAAPELLRRA